MNPSAIGEEILASFNSEGMPSHVILEEKHKKAMLPLLRSFRYHEIADFFHAHIQGDSHSKSSHSTSMLVYYRTEEATSP